MTDQVDAASVGVGDPLASAEDRLAQARRREISAASAYVMLLRALAEKTREASARVERLPTGAVPEPGLDILADARKAAEAFTDWLDAWDEHAEAGQAVNAARRACP